MLSNLDILVQQQRLKEHYRQADQYRLLQEALATNVPATRNGRITQALLWLGQIIENTGRRITDAGQRLEQNCFEPGQVVEAPCD